MTAVATKPKTTRKPKPRRRTTARPKPAVAVDPVLTLEDIACAISDGFDAAFGVAIEPYVARLDKIESADSPITVTVSVPFTTAVALLKEAGL